MIKLQYPRFWSKPHYLSYLLVPFSYIYRILGYFRTVFTKTTNLPQTVICIGNITVGGSGKTQVVSWLARILKAKNISFVIITKAYRSGLTKAVIVKNKHSAQEVGDEALILKNFGSVIAAKKIREALELTKKINPEIVILDDGMQNPSLQKDLNILVFDASRGIGNSKIFPAGPLREGLDSGLAKADLILYIGNTSNHSDLLNKIYDSKKPCFLAHTRLCGDLDKEKSYIAFAGIGNPEKFYSLLRQNNFKLKECISFEDHHNYSIKELKKLTTFAKVNQCSLITTEKDYVKLDNKYKKLITCAKVDLAIQNEQACISLIMNCAQST